MYDILDPLPCKDTSYIIWEAKEESKIKKLQKDLVQNLGIHQTADEAVPCSKWPDYTKYYALKRFSSPDIYNLLAPQIYHSA
jgi:hypothetical protein